MLDPTPTAVLFPGQGSQVAGMRDLVAEHRPDLLDAVVDLVGEDPFARVEESTRFAQPAILCASLAGWSRIRDLVAPTAMAGHSLGELSALAAAGALSDEDALELAVVRGRLMDEAGRRAGGGTMLALAGTTPARAAALAASHGVVVANDNAPDQVVLSGGREELAAAARAAERDGLKAIPLDVAGAFHSPQMQDAVPGFRAALARVDFRPPAVTVYSCASRRPFEDPERELGDALVAPVRWRSTMSALAADGISTFVDVGPGRVLAKLVRRNVADAAVARPDALLEHAHAVR